MTGQDLIYLSLYRVAYPKCTTVEISAFLYCANLGNPYFSFLFTLLTQPWWGVCWIGKKKGNTTTYQAFLLQNLRKKFPVGITDICRNMIIDLDEYGILLETHIDQKHGKAYLGVRLREERPYVKMRCTSI